MLVFERYREALIADGVVNVNARRSHTAAIVDCPNIDSDRLRGDAILRIAAQSLRPFVLELRIG